MKIPDEEKFIDLLSRFEELREQNEHLSISEIAKILEKEGLVEYQLTNPYLNQKGKKHTLKSPLKVYLKKKAGEFLEEHKGVMLVSHHINKFLEFLDIK